MERAGYPRSASRARKARARGRASGSTNAETDGSPEDLLPARLVSHRNGLAVGRSVFLLILGVDLVGCAVLLSEAHRISRPGSCPSDSGAQSACLGSTGDAVVDSLAPGQGLRHPGLPPGHAPPRSFCLRARMQCKPCRSSTPSRDAYGKQFASDPRRNRTERSVPDGGSLPHPPGSESG